MDCDFLVYVVGDDRLIRESLAKLFQGASLKYKEFRSAEEFLEDDPADSPSCLLLDLDLPGMSGVDLLEHLHANSEFNMPVLVFVGSVDVRSVARCFKLGVREFLAKPVNPELLLSLVRELLDEDYHRRQAQRVHAELSKRMNLLTPREEEMVNLICQGFSNKQIASKLSISIKTVANHRAHVLAKSGAHNTADMVRIAVLHSHPCGGGACRGCRNSLDATPAANTSLPINGHNKPDLVVI
jgi:FixJ family two-component response regulator